MAAANEWEPGTTGFSFVKTTIEANRDMYANSKQFGLTGWSGMLHDSGSFVTPNCVGGRWVRSTIVASTNSSYNSGSVAKRQGVMVHEFGHYLGLAHSNLTASCPGGGADYLAIMYPNDNRFTGNCAAYHPQGDDKAGANALH